MITYVEARQPYEPSFDSAQTLDIARRYQELHQAIVIVLQKLSMTDSKHDAVTPESIISIPEFEGPWPDASAERLLYIERKYCTKSQITSSTLKLLDIRTKKCQELYRSDSIQTAFWVESMPGMLVLFENARDGSLEVSVKSMDPTNNFSAGFVRVGSLPSGSRGLAAVAITKEDVIVAFSASIPKSQDNMDREHPGSSGREYTSMPVRSEGSWKTLQKATVFCATIDLSGSEPKLEGEHFDVLSGLDGQEHRPFGGVHLDRQGLAVIIGAHTPKVEEIPLTNILFMPLHAISRQYYTSRKILQVPGFHGASYSPTRSPIAGSLVFLQKRETWLEDDSSLVVVCEELYPNLKYSYHEIYRDEAQQLLLSPQKIELTADGVLCFLAEDRGEMRLFHTRKTKAMRLVAEPLTSGWSISSFLLLSDTLILLSGSTVTLPRHWATLSIPGNVLSTIYTGTDESDQLELDKITFESIEWPGADDLPVQAWLVKPPNFTPEKRYPLLYCIHGGPNAAFTNAWATSYWANWNFALFVAQGYVVVAPNFSGSTGFGQEYAKRVVGEHGGKPYVDLEKGMDFIENRMPFVDTERAVALGISYGGYMINRIQGQPLGRRFKALVAESGLLNTAALYSMDLIYFENHFGGPMYQDRTGYERYNPLNHIQNWATPTLVIANELDYRPPITEGLSVFQILQAKGIESRLLSFPDEGHITEKPANRLHWWHTVLEWCAVHTEHLSGSDAGA